MLSPSLGSDKVRGRRVESRQREEEGERESFSPSSGLDLPSEVGDLVSFVCEGLSRGRECPLGILV